LHTLSVTLLPKNTKIRLRVKVIASQMWGVFLRHGVVITVITDNQTTPLPQPFYGPFSGTIQMSWCQKRTSDFMVQGKINRGRHIDHPAKRHSIRTNQCPPSQSPIFTGWMPFLPPSQQCQSTEGN